MVIGRICKEVPVSRVREVIFGYTVANDVTRATCRRPMDSGRGPRATTPSVRSVRGSPPSTPRGGCACNSNYVGW